MKNKYTKPLLIIEKFELCEHIAINCGLEAGESNHWDHDSCNIDADGYGTYLLFYSTTTKDCNLTPEVLDSQGLTLDDIVVEKYHGRSFESFFSS